ncbi:MAG: hypothetical protein HY549_06835 [Elusimicrobia bacterium]|nr:hypothetical protein [Elusimicrobiota bacterium]
MTPLISDQTSASFEAALKATMRELVAQIPIELHKGIRQFVFLKRADARPPRLSVKVSTQYIYKDGAALIHVYLDHVDRKPWRLIPLSWRAWSRMRLGAEALSHPLARHRCRGKQQDEKALTDDARRIKALLMCGWVANWIKSQPVGPRAKNLLRRFCERRIRRICRE